MRKIFTWLELPVLFMEISGDFEAAFMYESGRFYLVREIMHKISMWLELPVLSMGMNGDF